jgi:Zn-dependent protease with chaperone function
MDRSASIIAGAMTFAGHASLAIAWLGVLSWLLANPPEIELVLISGVAVVLVGGYVGYRLGTTRLLTQLQSRTLSRRQAPGIHRQLDTLVETAGITRPQLLVADLGGPNALSLGGPQHGYIVFDRRLLGLLSHDERGGILAHEFAHLERRDALVSTLTVTAGRVLVGVVGLFLGPVVVFARGIDKAVALSSNDGRTQTAGRLTQTAIRAIEFGVTALFSIVTLAVLAYSRHREYAADQRAASLTDQPLALARALQRVHQSQSAHSGLLSILYVDHDQRPRWFSTHPPLDDRVARLRRLSEQRVRSGPMATV